MRSARARKVALSSLLAVALMVLGSCSEPNNIADPLSDIAEVVPSKFALAALTDRVTPAGPQANHLEFAEKVKGYGGAWFDSVGNLHAYIKAGGDKARLSELLRPELKHFYGPSNQKRSANRSVIIHTGTLDFVELIRLKRFLGRALERVDGFQMIAISHSKNQIILGVTTQEAASTIQKFLTAQKVQPNAVRIELQPRATQLATLQDSVRPLYGGLIIGLLDPNTFYAKTCSFGFSANTNTNFFTASHCTFNIGVVEGARVSQPSPFGVQFGIESADPPLWEYDGAPDNCCPTIEPHCRETDVAKFTYTQQAPPHTPGSQLIYKNTYAATGDGVSGTIDIAGTTTITGEAVQFYEGSFVYKTGQVTGTTYGAISTACGDFRPFGGQTWFLCQLMIAPTRGDVGDSGAPAYFLDAGGQTGKLAGIVTMGVGSGSILVSRVDLMHKPKELGWFDILY